MKLHLGVNDVPEFESDMPLIDLAKILEHKYGLFTNFVEMHRDDIEQELVKSLNSQITRIMARRKVTDPFRAGLERIEDDFQEYLTNEELSGIVEGVPTAVSLANKSRIPGAKRRGRSFVDTGTLRTNLRVWIEA